VNLAMSCRSVCVSLVSLLGVGCARSRNIKRKRQEENTFSLQGEVEGPTTRAGFASLVWRGVAFVVAQLHARLTGFTCVKLVFYMPPPFWQNQPRRTCPPPLLPLKRGLIMIGQFLLCP
jgi:hypothetical protein